ncbi:hypothetical protein [Methanorbis rubei]|uniref:Fido domain-containing protein n=1 Tax=Methanorbis rubei TaxID=3028300 RepID=A0AAE4MFA5_9EURY|nr:hypothetical protein [Methanocorpusculaceae archaeon Cs1]
MHSREAVSRPKRLLKGGVKHGGTACGRHASRGYLKRIHIQKNDEVETYYISRAPTDIYRMKKDIYFRIEPRVQNSVVKYYLLREVNSDARKFRASKLIKAGVMPTDAEVSRSILMHGFDLEMKCCEKVASYRVQNFRYEHAADENAYLLLEKYRYLDLRYHDYLNPEEIKDHIKDHEYHYVHQSAKTIGNTFTFSEVAAMLDTGKIPNGKFLRDVNEIQNLYACSVLRNADTRKVTLALIQKLRNMILANIQTPEKLTRENEIAVQKQLTRFYKRVADGYHPAEQVFLWHREFRTLKPFQIGTRRVAREVVHYMILPFGYPLAFQSSMQTIGEDGRVYDRNFDKVIPELFEKYIGNRIPELEAELRKKINEKWDIQKNKLQKQLDLYLPSDT